MRKREVDKMRKVPADHLWACTFCGKPHPGESPPDECLGCANEYFDNVADLVTGQAGY